VVLPLEVRGATKGCLVQRVGVGSGCKQFGSSLSPFRFLPPQVANVVCRSEGANALERCNDLVRTRSSIREPLPPAVTDFRSQLSNSAGVIISSPEYAHGIPGLLKNALDWLVASGELYEKPVALFNTSPRTSYAQVSQVTGHGGLHMSSNADLSKRIECALSTFVKAIDLTYVKRCANKQPDRRAVTGTKNAVTLDEVHARGNIAGSHWAIAQIHGTPHLQSEYLFGRIFSQFVVQLALSFCSDPSRRWASFPIRVLQSPQLRQPQQYPEQPPFWPLHADTIAEEILVNRTMRGMERIHYKELEPLAQRYGIKMADWQLRGRSLLSRDATGNYKFAHRSIMEFLFVSRFLTGKVEPLPEPWTDLMKKWL